jgi:hypothetical protein
LDQPSPHPIKAKEFVDCLLWELPSDFENEERHATLARRQARDGIGLDKFISNVKAKHKAHIPTEDMSLLHSGFIVSVAREASSLPLDKELEIEEQLVESVIAPTEHPPLSNLGATSSHPADIAETDRPLGQSF